MNKPDAQKVLIYAHHQRGLDLLVFDEPDFPEVPLQVPGGTIEHGEDPLDAARREFFEETGLEAPGISAIGCYDYDFVKNSCVIRHRRHIFSVGLAIPVASAWIHFEEHACDGAAPIRFRLHFMNWRAAADRLGLGMADPLSWPGLQKRLA